MTVRSCLHASCLLIRSQPITLGQRPRSHFMTISNQQSYHQCVYSERPNDNHSSFHVAHTLKHEARSFQPSESDTSNEENQFHDPRINILTDIEICRITNECRSLSPYVSTLTSFSQQLYAPAFQGGIWTSHLNSSGNWMFHHISQTTRHQLSISTHSRPKHLRTIENAQGTD